MHLAETQKVGILTGEGPLPISPEASVYRVCLSALNDLRDERFPRARAAADDA